MLELLESLSPKARAVATVVPRKLQFYHDKVERSAAALHLALRPLRSLPRLFFAVPAPPVPPEGLGQIGIRAVA